MYNYFSKIVSALVLTTLFFGCDLATTRDAEKPESGRSSYVIATTSDQLFINLRNSFLERISKDYISSFVDSSFLNTPFVFTPSADAVFKFGSLADWNLESEDIYFRNLVNETEDKGNIILTLELISNSVEGNIESRNYNYSILLPAIDETTASFYEGNAFFKINLDNNNQWVITEWVDTKTSENPTWSELKGRFY